MSFYADVLRIGLGRRMINVYLISLFAHVDTEKIPIAEKKIFSRVVLKTKQFIETQDETKIYTPCELKSEVMATLETSQEKKIFSKFTSHIKHVRKKRRNRYSKRKKYRTNKKYKY